MAAMTDTRMNSNMHLAFLRDIDLVKRGLTAIDLSNEAQRAGVADRYAFFSAVLHEHHTVEDTYLWPKVMASATPQEQDILNSMESEHASLVALLDKLDQAFASLNATSDKASLTADLDKFREILAAHCAHEEAEGINVVQKYLTEADFAEFKSATRHGPNASYVLPWVCDGASKEVCDSTWGMIPAVPRAIVRPMLTRKYNKFKATWI